MAWLIFLSILFVSSVSFIGALFLVFSRPIRQKTLVLLVALSAGALLASAFLELLPKTLELVKPRTAFSVVLFSFFFFFVLEKVLHWRHCHNNECQEHAFGYLNLTGDCFHNFLDGLIISAAFLTDLRVGLAASLAILLHEIPQEIGDLGVLLFAGFKPKKALLFNFLTALTAFLGAGAGLLLSFSVYNFLIYLVLPFSAGGFIYIAASDLLPEIRKTQQFGQILLVLACLFLGCSLVFLPELFGL